MAQSNGDDVAAPGGSLVANLLPEADDPEDTKPRGLVPRPCEAEGGTDCYNSIRQAIYAPPGTDLSHLTEYQRKLVEICQKDEDECNRVLFGGGLY